MSHSVALRENLANRDVCTEGLPDPMGKAPAKESRGRRFAGVGVGTMVMREQMAGSGTPGSVGQEDGCGAVP